MKKIRIDGRIFTGPGSWEELDRGGLLQYAKVISCKETTDDQVKHQLVMRLMKIPYNLFKRLPEPERVKTHEAIDWVYTQNTLTNWLLPVVSLNGKKVYGPADGLDDITGEEFMFCELAFERYLLDENTDHAIDIFTALYRKRRFWSSDRRRFSPKFMKKLELYGKYMSPAFKEAILINYAGCRNQIIALHPHVWIQAAAGDGDGSGAGMTSWASLFMDISGGKWGPYPQTIRTNLFLLLKDMDKTAENAEPFKRP